MTHKSESGDGGIHDHHEHNRRTLPDDGHPHADHHTTTPPSLTPNHPLTHDNHEQNAHTSPGDRTPHSKKRHTSHQRSSNRPNHIRGALLRARRRTTTTNTSIRHLLTHTKRIQRAQLHTLRRLRQNKTPTHTTPTTETTPQQSCETTHWGRLPSVGTWPNNKPKPQSPTQRTEPTT